MKIMLRCCLVIALILPCSSILSVPPAAFNNANYLQIAQAGITCPKCHKNNQPDAKFCNFCGTRMPKPPPAPPPAPPPPPQQPDQPPPPPPPPQKNAQPLPEPAPMPPPPAKDGWTLIGSSPATDGATEFKVDRQISNCRMTCSDGKVIINTLVVRRGSDKKPIAVRANIKAGESVEIPISPPANVTGFRISHEGRGTFNVYVK